jgi:hypothetical protein
LVRAENVLISEQCERLFMKLFQPWKAQSEWGHTRFAIALPPTFSKGERICAQFKKSWDMHL